MVHVYFDYTAFADTGASAVLPPAANSHGRRGLGWHANLFDDFIFAHRVLRKFRTFYFYISWLRPDRRRRGAVATFPEKTCQVWIFQFSLHLQNPPKADFPDEF
jgi:hypothetical protein